MTDPAFDPYKTPQVDPEAEDEVIAAAYRRLARKYHPDAIGDRAAAASGASGAASARMAALNAAWELIGDPARRAAFDRGLIARALFQCVGLAPPLCATPADVDRMVAILEDLWPEAERHVLGRS